MERGFLLGKFMPPHAGHLFLCDVARARVDELTVLVCSHDAEPIPGSLRAQWMRQSLAGQGVRIVHMHRDIPQEPRDHPQFWNIWRDAIFEHHPDPIDWVFGSEPYIHQLAEVVGARPFLVDDARLNVPVSGSAIRTAPQRHWAHIPLPVRPYFQRRVTLLGPESTGKSTMSARLAEHFKTLIIPEYGRDYDATFTQGGDWQPADLIAIARGHAALATEIAKRAGPMVIEDTDLVQTIVWAEMLLGEAPQALIDHLDSFTPPALYLLLSPDQPWVDDGTRYHADLKDRTFFYQRLLHWLDRFETRCVMIEGRSWQHRYKQADTAIREAFSDLAG